MGILGGLCHAWLVRFVNIVYICQQLFRKGPSYKRRHRMKMAELDLLVQQNINMPPNQYVTNQTTKRTLKSNFVTHFFNCSLPCGESASLEVVVEASMVD